MRRTTGVGVSPLCHRVPMTEELVITAFEACAAPSGDEICAHCGWLDHEHAEIVKPVVELQAA